MSMFTLNEGDNLFETIYLNEEEGLQWLLSIMRQQLF